MDGSLDRFAAAQDATWPQALAELRAGAKRGHWMWFVFPQLAGLGSSPMARRYGIADLGEARAYLAHPVLGPRLIEATHAMLAHRAERPEAILGPVDAMKLRSCLTLFEAAGQAGREPGASGGEACFSEALAAFYHDRRDPLTLAVLDR